MIDVVGRLPLNTRRADDRLSGALGPDLVGRLPVRERLGLGEEVREEQLVYVLVAVLQRVRRCGDGDEVGRDQLRALVDELVERRAARSCPARPRRPRRWRS